MTDQPTTPHAPPTPDDATAREGGLPDELWAVRFRDASLFGNNDLWISVARDREVARRNAQAHWGGELILIGVSPARLVVETARAEKAEAERDAMVELIISSLAPQGSMVWLPYREGGYPDRFDSPRMRDSDKDGLALYKFDTRKEMVDAVILSAMERAK